VVLHKVMMNVKSDVCDSILVRNHSVSVPKPAAKCFWYGAWRSTEYC